VSNLGKLAGLDGVYPEFIKNSGRKTKEWLVRLFNDILTTGKLPKLFKQAKIIAILKPGKDGTDASHYRPISLLSVVYKIFEQLILQRIQPFIVSSRFSEESKLHRTSHGSHITY
jgi:hypothetical protein